jgi:putative tryptophan/tyrosine transport system substrate-binding protein
VVNLNTAKALDLTIPPSILPRGRGHRVNRRELIILFGGAPLLDISSGRAQESGRVHRLGIMSGFPRRDVSFIALFDALRRSGLIEGENLQVVGRFSMREEEAPEIAAMLIAAGVEAIMTGGYPRARVVQRATSTIPILIIADDLLLSGLVTSLAHPGAIRPGSASWRPSSTASVRSS